MPREVGGMKGCAVVLITYEFPTNDCTIPGPLSSKFVRTERPGDWGLADCNINCTSWITTDSVPRMGDNWEIKVLYWSLVKSCKKIVCFLVCIAIAAIVTYSLKRLLENGVKARRNRTVHSWRGGYQHKIDQL